MIENRNKMAIAYYRIGYKHACLTVGPYRPHKILCLMPRNLAIMPAKVGIKSHRCASFVNVCTYGTAQLKLDTRMQRLTCVYRFFQSHASTLPCVSHVWNKRLVPVNSFKILINAFLVKMHLPL